jgi:CheY-like chemotaxis protein
MESPATSGPDAGASSGQALRILLADDNADLTESFSELLRAMGHSVEVVGDGEAALQAAVANVPDVALLDIGMPRRNGYDVARCLRSNAGTSRIRLVAITGWGQASDKRTAKEAGFDLHFVKPVDPDDLLRQLAEFSDGAVRVTPSIR